MYFTSNTNHAHLIYLYTPHSLTLLKIYYFPLYLHALAHLDSTRVTLGQNIYMQLKFLFPVNLNIFNEFILFLLANIAIHTCVNCEMIFYNIMNKRVKWQNNIQLKSKVTKLANLLVKFLTYGNIILEILDFKTVVFPWFFSFKT